MYTGEYISPWIELTPLLIFSFGNSLTGVLHLVFRMTDPVLKAHTEALGYHLTPTHFLGALLNGPIGILLYAFYMYCMHGGLACLKERNKKKGTRDGSSPDRRNGSMDKKAGLKIS